MRLRAVRAGVLASVATLGVVVGQQKTFEFRYLKSATDGDEIEAVGTGGLWYSFGGREVKAESVVVRLDRDEFYALEERRSKGLPRRGTHLPGDRRKLSAQLLADRLKFFLASLGSPRPATDEHRDSLLLFRSVYLEGNVTIIDKGVVVLTAKSFAFSVPDNRVVLVDAEMRLISESASRGRRMLVLRAPKLVKQGIRTTGRDVSLTTCTAGKPHFEVLSEEIEIIERGKEFEVFSRGNNLAFSGRKTVPLPNAHFFTGDQTDIPLRGARFTYSRTRGAEATLDFGSGWNDLGGTIHEFLTGRPAHEFRGDWQAGVNYIQKRGTALDGELRYRAGELYEGRTTGFFIGNDRGPNRFAIVTDLDGRLIDDSQRHLIQTENRIRFAENWRVDLTAFSASDASVWPEYYTNQYFEAEVPETSGHLRHADDNRLFTLTGRTNLASFSYSDERMLAPSFRNEAPLATYDVFSEPLFAIGEVDVLLTSSTSAGVLENEFDPRSRMPLPPVNSDRTFRLDQEVEVAAPFHLGPFAVRPRVSGRFTYYDDSVDGTAKERWALEAGVSLTTRLSRTFKTTDGAGRAQKIRHSMYPSIAVGHLFQVDGDPTDFHQFDQLDALNENGYVRVGLLNRLQKTTATRRVRTFRNPFDPRDSYRETEWSREFEQREQAREFLFLDLAQNFFPNRDRDNGGDFLGLAEYELIWRPHNEWIPVHNLGFIVEGEHDWRNDRMNTFNAITRFGKVLGCHWQAGYRADHMVRGAAIYGVSTDLFGRWTLMGSGAYDLERKDQLHYSAMLIRRDHDWVITAGLFYDAIQDITSFRVDFEPLFGGVRRRRSDEFGGMTGRGNDAMLNY